MSEPISYQIVSEFLYTEANLLDERRYDTWLKMFSRELEYWVPIRQGQESPLDEVSIFHENRAALELRVSRLMHPEIHIQIPPSRTCRQVTNIVRLKRGSDSGTVVFQSKLVLHEYRPKLPQVCFAATCFHTLSREEGALKIRKKKVVLINSDAALPPLSFPF